MFSIMRIKSAIETKMREQLPEGIRLESHADDAGVRLIASVRIEGDALISLSVLDDDAFDEEATQRIADGLIAQLRKDAQRVANGEPLIVRAPRG